LDKVQLQTAEELIYVHRHGVENSERQTNYLQK